MLRPCVIDDLDQIIAIDQQCFPVAWNSQQYTYELLENAYAFLWVLEENHQIVGFIDYWITFEICQLAKIAVQHDMRGNGYAKQMMEWMIQDSRLKGCENISLEVRISNNAAISLYESFDFINANIRKGYYQDNGEDAYVLIKAL